MNSNAASHVPHFGCPETPEHATTHTPTPLYDAAAFEQAEYERQVADGHARGGAA